MNLLPEFEYEHRVDSIVSSIRGSMHGDGDEAMVFMEATDQMHRQRDEAERAVIDQNVLNNKQMYMQEATLKKEKKKIKIL